MRGGALVIAALLSGCGGGGAPEPRDEQTPKTIANSKRFVDATSKCFVDSIERFDKSREIAVNDLSINGLRLGQTHQLLESKLERMRKGSRASEAFNRPLNRLIIGEDSVRFKGRAMVPSSRGEPRASSIKAMGMARSDEIKSLIDEMTRKFGPPRIRATSFCPNQGRPPTGRWSLQKEETLIYSSERYPSPFWENHRVACSMKRPDPLPPDAMPYMTSFHTVDHDRDEYVCSDEARPRGVWASIWILWEGQGGLYRITIQQDGLGPQPPGERRRAR